MEESQWTASDRRASLSRYTRAVFFSRQRDGKRRSMLGAWSGLFIVIMYMHDASQLYFKHGCQEFTNVQ